jgi:glutaminase
MLKPMLDASGYSTSSHFPIVRAPSALLGACVVGTCRNVCVAGDADHEFSTMSVSKSEA